MSELQTSEQIAALTTHIEDITRYDELKGSSRVPKGARPDSAAAPSPAATLATPSNPYVAPLVIVCEHTGFGGAQWISSNGWTYVGDWWNDRISSIIVVSGRWRFYEAGNYGGASWELGPGYYSNLAAVNIPNDVISSFRPVAW